MIHTKKKGWLKNKFMDAFPVPRYMMMPAAGLDISSNSIKYLNGRYMSKGCLPQVFYEAFLPEGTIVDGIVRDSKAFVTALKEVKEHSNDEFLFVAIPENALYLYTLRIAGKPNKKAILQQIEFSFNDHVPLALERAVYDFDIIGISKQGGTYVSVTAAPKKVILGYEKALSSAGFTVRGIELEAYAVVRSVSTHHIGTPIQGVEMIVDVGYERAGIIIAKNSIPIFSITIAGGSKTIDVVLEECKKQFSFWDTRTNNKGKRIERITKISVCGGSGGQLQEPLQNALQRNVVHADVWQNLFNLDEYIPHIEADRAHSMATLAGLLLQNKQ